MNDIINNALTIDVLGVSHHAIISTFAWLLVYIKLQIFYDIIPIMQVKMNNGSLNSANMSDISENNAG